MFSPEILECDDPLFEQDEASGEQHEIPKSFVRELVSGHLPLLSTLSDMDSGLIRLSMGEYNELSHKFMTAWLFYKAQKAEKLKREKQGN